MTQFPDIYHILQEGMDVEELDGSEEVRAEDGTLYIRRLWPESRFRITFRLGLLTPQQVSNVRQFCRSYLSEEIEWHDTFLNDTYRALLLRPPKLIRTEGLLSVMEIYMEGVRLDPAP